MRIALDATYSIGEALSGVGIYSREILAGLAASCPDDDLLFCYRPHRFVRSFSLPLPRAASRRLLYEPLAPRADVFHGLNQRLPKMRLRRAVSTFHDLFVLTGDYSSPEFRARFAEQARDAARRSDLIIAVSEFTARQVEDLLGVDRAKLRVVRHGVRAPAATPAIPKEKLILHVGAVQRRKNITRLVEAFERLEPGWLLVLAGSMGYGSEDIVRRIEASPRRDAIRLAGYVSPAALEDLYARASILAFPSLDEGFGMPVLEAMARGIPVLTSNRSALPEVAGDAAMLADPESTDAIAAGLGRLTGDESLREVLRQRGLARAKTFTWEEAVARTRAIYEELAGAA